MITQISDTIWTIDFSDPIVLRLSIYIIFTFLVLSWLVANWIDRKLQSIKSNNKIT